jgi:hypothetical protein
MRGARKWKALRLDVTAALRQIRRPMMDLAFRDSQQAATSRQTVRKPERRLSARDLPLPDYRMRSVAALALVFAQRLAPL